MIAVWFWRVALAGLVIYNLFGCSRESRYRYPSFYDDPHMPLARYNGCTAELTWNPSSKSIKLKPDWDPCGVFIPVHCNQSLRDWFLIAFGWNPNTFKEENLDKVEVVYRNGKSEVIPGRKFLDAQWQRSVKACHVKEIRTSSTKCGRPSRVEWVVYASCNSNCRTLLPWRDDETVARFMKRAQVTDWQDKRITILRRTGCSGRGEYKVYFDGAGTKAKGIVIKPYDALVIRQEKDNRVYVLGEVYKATVKEKDQTGLLWADGVGVISLPSASSEAAIVTKEGEVKWYEQLEAEKRVRNGEILFYAPWVSCISARWCTGG